MKPFSQFISESVLPKRTLLEYLTPKQRELYSSVKMDPIARKRTDHFFGKDNDFVKEDVPDYPAEKSEPHKVVEQHLGMEISPQDYRAGNIPDPKYPNRRISLGKLIQDKDVLKQFASDNTRQGARAVQNPHVTIHRGTEVAGQTNSVPDEKHPSGHSWGNMSCKNIETGGENAFLDTEIQNGTVVVFGHNHDGQEIYRATLQPFTSKSGKSTVYGLDSEYGVRHPAFTRKANEIARRLSSGKPNSELHHINDEVYNDSGISTMYHPDMGEDDIHSIIKNMGYRGEKIRASEAVMALSRQPQLNSGHITKIIDRMASINKDGDPYEDEYPDSAHAIMELSKHPKFTSDHLTQMFDKPIYRDNTDSTLSRVPVGILDDGNLNNIVKPSHITKILDGNTTEELKHAAIKHPSANEDNFNHALDKFTDTYTGLDVEGLEAIRNNKNLPSNLIKSLVNMTHPAMQKSLGLNDSITKGKLKTFANSLLSHRNMPEDMLHKAVTETMDDKTYEGIVKMGFLAKSPNLKSEHIHQLMQTPFPELKGKKFELSSGKAVQAYADNMQKLRLNESHERHVLSNLFHNPQFGSEHIEKAMEDKSAIPGVDMVSRINSLSLNLAHKMTDEQLHKAFDHRHATTTSRSYLLDNIPNRDIPEDLQMKYAKKDELHSDLSRVRNLTKAVVRESIKHTPKHAPMFELAETRPELWDDDMVHSALKKDTYMTPVLSLLKSPVASGKTLEHAWKKFGKTPVSRFGAGRSAYSELQHAVIDHPNVTGKILRNALKHGDFTIRNKATAKLNK